MNHGVVIICALNEASMIAAIVEEVRRSVSDYDVLVIGYGSTDDTAGLEPPTP